MVTSALTGLWSNFPILTAESAKPLIASNADAPSCDAIVSIPVALASVAGARPAAHTMPLLVPQYSPENTGRLLLLQRQLRWAVPYLRPRRQDQSLPVLRFYILNCPYLKRTKCL
ncbi:hypothetical protein N8T08_010389 [Aspergillus melleus]|uniref:Uncharacterized protein n=1 Tax=Aspergillus melleus TaxID=138277 RepID=A0ACC3ASC0_9EURO|nr:hypothetical protein N8T08_010389 [Aspergillus melleus]